MIHCTAKIETVDGDPLTTGQVLDWLERLPVDSEIKVEMRDRGTQRDPEEYLHALVVTWVQEAP